MPPVSVSTTTSFEDFNGATAGVALPVNFPVMAITNIFMAKLLVGGEEFIDLVPDVDFTRTDLGGGNYEVETVDTYASGITIRVYRLTPRVQEFEFANVGPLPPERIEAALDYRCMIEQEIAMLSGAIPMTPPAGTLDVPFGGTGKTSFGAHRVIAAGAFSTDPLQDIASSGVIGHVLTDRGPSALPEFAALPATGDVTGPASALPLALAMYADATGKILLSDPGTDSVNGGPSLDAGDIEDTTARPFLIEQGWNNAALVGALMQLAINNTTSSAASTFLQALVNGSSRGKWMRDGHWRLLDGTSVAPILSFESAGGTGIYRDTPTGDLCFAIASTDIMRLNGSGTEIRLFDVLRVGPLGFETFQATATSTATSVVLIPATDGTIDLGRISGGTNRWRHLIQTGLQATGAAPTIASAGTIAPTTERTFISGVAAIDTITPPAPIASGGGRITLIPTGIFTWTTAGNIALAGTAVVSKALDMFFDSVTSKWYPSYT